MAFRTDNLFNLRSDDGRQVRAPERLVTAAERERDALLARRVDEYMSGRSGDAEACAQVAGGGIARATNTDAGPHVAPGEDMSAVQRRMATANANAWRDGGNRDALLASSGEGSPRGDATTTAPAEDENPIAAAHARMMKRHASGG